MIDARKKFMWAVWLLIALVFVTACESDSINVVEKEGPDHGRSNKEESVALETTAITLEPAGREESVYLEEAFSKRRSTRTYDDRPLAMVDVSRLLWAATGPVPDAVSTATRYVPSAGATHPIELYLAAGDVEGLDPGIYHYQPATRELVLHSEGDLRNQLAQAALGQEMIARAPATIIIAADFQRTIQRYGSRGQVYVYMESGGVAQNIALQAAALRMGNVVVGAFQDDALADMLQIGAVPLLIIPLGYIAD